MPTVGVTDVVRRSYSSGRSSPPTKICGRLELAAGSAPQRVFGLRVAISARKEVANYRRISAAASPVLCFFSIESRRGSRHDFPRSAPHRRGRSHGLRPARAHGGFLDPAKSGVVLRVETQHARADSLAVAFALPPSRLMKLSQGAWRTVRCAPALNRRSQPDSRAVGHDHLNRGAGSVSRKASAARLRPTTNALMAWGGQLSTPMTEPDADRLCLLSDRSVSPFQGFRYSAAGVLDFECALNARRSSFVQGTRPAIFVLAIHSVPLAILHRSIVAR